MNEIILNENLAKALLDNTSRRKNLYKSESLFALLMYEKAWISSSFNRDFQKLDDSNLLKSENLLSVIDEKYYDDEEQDIVNAIDLFQKNLEMKLALEIRDDPYQKIYDEDSEFYLRYANNSIGLIKNIVFSTWEKRYPKLHINLSRGICNLDYAFFAGIPLKSGIRNLVDGMKMWMDGFHIRITDLMDDDNTPDLDSWFGEDFYEYLFEKGIVNRGEKANVKFYSLYRKNKRKFWNILLDIELSKILFIAEYLNLKELLSFGSKQNIPVRIESSINPQSNIYTYKKKIINPENHFGVYKIILDEIEYMPKINSIEEVLELRNDKRIEDFKNVIKEWSLSLKEGKKNERKIRQEIRLANRELRKFPNHQKIAGWATYISIPLIIVDVLTHMPIGSIMTLISGVYNFKADRAKKKNSWLLIGNKHI